MRRTVPNAVGGVCRGLAGLVVCDPDDEVDDIPQFGVVRASDDPIVVGMKKRTAQPTQQRRPCVARPRRDPLRATTTPSTKYCPPQTPAASPRARAPASSVIMGQLTQTRRTRRRRVGEPDPVRCSGWDLPVRDRGARAVVEQLERAAWVVHLPGHCPQGVRLDVMVRLVGRGFRSVSASRWCRGLSGFGQDEAADPDKGIRGLDVVCRLGRHPERPGECGGAPWPGGRRPWS